ncbi:MAG TPA: histidine kinase [Stellaceae bacterium]|nr:histidine kinase [Stellaceae bacterium]
MSLRVRLIGLVATVLAVSLAFGGLIAAVNASRSVRNEMRSALIVGRQTIENGVRDLPGAADPRRDLERLVASFRGNRHLRVTLTEDASAIALPPVESAPFGRLPRWFIDVVGVAPAIERVPVTVAGRSYGSVVLETDPHNEILEVWDQLGDSLMVLGLFSGLTVLLIYFFTGRALRPLERMGAALERVGRGDYGTRIEERLTPELARLRDSFNRMVAQLAEVDADNRRLNEQLLILQEQERKDLARDLHDEVGPFLFAINLDVANLSRLLREGRAGEAARHVQGIAEAVGRMQRQVRSMLGRLRPVGLTEFGLTAALDNLVEFWRRRHPDIDYRISMAPGCADLGEATDITVYRVVQECLSNAVRHGRPSTIGVAIERAERGPDRAEVTVQVSDDGRGLKETSVHGLGLLGMSERVRARGGRLALANRSGGGLTVTAVVPCSRQREEAPEAAQAGVT